MLVIPTWAAENSYVPLPQVVSDNIFGLFIIEDQLIDLYPKTLPGCTGQLLSPDVLIMVYCWGLWLLLQLELPLPEEGEPPDMSLGNCGLSCLLFHLLPWPAMLRMSISPPRLAINCIAISCSHFGSIFFHSLHPHFNALFHGRGAPYLCHSVGMPCPWPWFSFPHQHLQWLSDIPVQYLWSPLHELSYQPIDGANQAESYISGVSQGEPFLEWPSSKEYDCIPCGKDYSFGNPLFKTLLKHIHN